MIEPADWSPEIAAYLTRACPAATEAELKAQADAGAACFAVTVAGRRIGAYMLRLDRTPEGAEGVIVAASGDWCGVDLIGLILPAMEAQFEGVRALRLHTHRPGLGRRLARMGWQPQEIVFRKEIHQ